LGVESGVVRFGGEEVGGGEIGLTGGGRGAEVELAGPGEDAAGFEEEVEKDSERKLDGLKEVGLGPEDEVGGGTESEDGSMFIRRERWFFLGWITLTPGAILNKSSGLPIQLVFHV